MCVETGSFPALILVGRSGFFLCLVGREGAGTAGVIRGGLYFRGMGLCGTGFPDIGGGGNNKLPVCFVISTNKNRFD